MVRLQFLASWMLDVGSETWQKIIVSLPGECCKRLCMNFCTFSSLLQRVWTCMLRWSALQLKPERQQWAEPQLTCTGHVVWIKPNLYCVMSLRFGDCLFLPHNEPTLNGTPSNQAWCKYGSAPYTHHGSTACTHWGLGDVGNSVTYLTLKFHQSSTLCQFKYVQGICSHWAFYTALLHHFYMVCCPLHVFILSTTIKS